MYRYENDQLYKVNFAIYAVEALTNSNPNRYELLHKQQKLQDNLRNPNNQIDPNVYNEIKASNNFVSTLYIGFYKNNLYALPTLIYNTHINGIEGPSPSLIVDEHQNESNNNLIEDMSNKNETNSIAIGHHKVPEKLNKSPNDLQPNKKIFVVYEDDDNFISFPEILNKKQPLCPADKEKPKTQNKFPYNLFKKFDELFQNKYFLVIFTVILGVLVNTAKNRFDRFRRVNHFFCQTKANFLKLIYTLILNRRNKKSHEAKRSIA